MKKLLITLILVFSATLMFAQKEEYKREINKEFNVSANAYLSITNKYGNVNIVEGNEGKIVFTIKITGKGKNSATAKEYAEGVDVNFTNSSNHVSAITSIKSMKCNNCGVDIDYVVVVPRSTTMDFDIKYGNLTLKDTPKPLKTVVKYGNITANIIADATIYIEYGNTKITKADNLKLGSKYSNITINDILSIKSDSKYDNFKIGTINDFNLATGYATVKIEKLNKSFVANDFKYCSLSIVDVADDFSKIKIDAAYTTLKIGLTERHNFKAALYTEYGDIKSGNIKFNDVSLSKKNSIVGNAGKSSNPTAEVNISVRYGDIVFR